ncbi:MAG: hypothetical protein KatS3mg031_0400 [Chitinophagales bacterium]|nr:MAG: hypothetical protein KatS3mg031_0400 [Chitinophagales bacterium]
MKSTLFLLVCLVLTSVRSIGQEGKVFGKITDAETHEPLVGAHVVAEPTLITEGTAKEIKPKIITTDIEGKYTFQLPPGTWTIDVKYIGYERVRQRIKVAANTETEVSFSLNPEALGLELVTVSASKYEKKLGEESVSIQVLTPEFIQNNNAITLDEAIDKVPGVNMIGETVNIRGGAGYSANAGSRVLMLLDDVPWMTPHNSGIEFWALPLESIKQVEIIKGASSTFYGSAALNGTMNLITENPKQEPYYKILAFYGAYENPFKGNKKKYYWSDRPRMFNGFAFVHRRKFNDKFDLSLNTAFNRDESYLYKDEKNILRGFLKLRYRPTENLTIGVGTNVAYQYGDFYFIWAADTLPNGQSI